MNKRTLQTLLVAGLAGSVLGGCGIVGPTHYSCPAPNGVTCMSESELYQATEDTDQVTGHAHQEHAGVRTGVPKRQARIDLVNDALTLNDDSMDPRWPAVAAPAEIPVRTPSRVMRIWVAPWEDGQGDLHVGGVVYTEIEPRRWSIGEPTPAQGGQYQLIQPLKTQSSRKGPVTGPQKENHEGQRSSQHTRKVSRQPRQTS
jgi:conjugal transfer pilus assembly protein TraV